MPVKAATAARRVKNCRYRTAPIIIKAGSIPIRIYSGKSNGYDLFTVVYYSGGRRKREGFSDLARARDRANEIRCRLCNDTTAVLDMDNVDRDSYVRAMALLKPLGEPLHCAIEEYVAAKRLLGDGTLLPVVKAYVSERCNDVPVQQVVDEMMALKAQSNLSVRYIQTLRYRLKRFAGMFATTSIGRVRAKDIDDWLGGLNLRPRGRNNFRQALVTLFKFAQRRGYLPEGRTAAENSAAVKERTGEIGILAPADLTHLMKIAPSEFGLYFALGAFTGMRSAEILKLEWADINFERGHIIVAAEKAKTATRRIVPVLPNLAEWLRPYRTSSGRIFTSRRLVDRAIRFAKRNGVKWPSNALRHSYATYRLAAIADTARVALEMGNSPQKLMTNYRELADERDATNWFGISPRGPANVLAFDTALCAWNRNKQKNAN